MRQKMPTALRGRSGVSGRRLLLGGLLPCGYLLDKTLFFGFVSKNAVWQNDERAAENQENIALYGLHAV